MAQTATINTRIDARTKQQALKVLDKLHLSMSEAIAIYLRQIIFHQGIPFELKIPNKTTAAAIDQARNDKDLAGFSSVDDLFDDLESRT
jgi:DNA-damage-inducible protein J